MHLVFLPFAVASMWIMILWRHLQAGKATAFPERFTSPWSEWIPAAVKASVSVGSQCPGVCVNFMTVDDSRC